MEAGASYKILYNKNSVLFLNYFFIIIIYYLLFVICYLLFVICYLLFVICYLLLGLKYIIIFTFFKDKYANILQPHSIKFKLFKVEIKKNMIHNNYYPIPELYKVFNLSH
jgi:hypothetical protein